MGKEVGGCVICLNETLPLSICADPGYAILLVICLLIPHLLQCPQTMEQQKNEYGEKQKYISFIE